MHQSFGTKGLLLYPGAMEVPNLLPELSQVVSNHSLAFFYSIENKLISYYLVKPSYPTRIVT